MAARVEERNRELWMLAVSPGIWAGHFLLAYATAALWCTRLAGRDASLGPVRVAIAAYTVVALVGVALVGWRGWRHHRLPGGQPPHDDDTPEDRHRFLGLATLLLSALSAVAVGYGALPVVFMESCR